MNFSFRLVGEWFPMFLEASIMTVKIFVISAILALCLGSVVSMAMNLGKRPLTYFLQVYVSVFRNSPLIVQLFFFFYGLPFAGIMITPFMTGVMAIALNEGAFMAEIMRGTINGIPKNDWEAAESLGLTQLQILRKVIFPQAFRNAIPVLTGQISLIIKDTSILSMIMLIELTRVGNIIYNKYLDFTGLIFASIIYVVIFIVINSFSSILEKKLRVRR